MRKIKSQTAAWLVAGTCWLLGGAPGSLATPASGQDLERFLPPNGNSVYEASGLLRTWPADGLKENWRTEVGWGKSAVVEAQGRAFTAAETDDKQWALGLDPATGKTLWKRLLTPKSNTHFARGPVTSPVIDEDRVYFISYDKDKDVWDMKCPIVCFQLDGTELWRADQTFWATEGSTPLVIGDTLYVSADNPDRVILVALDKRTGALQWSVAMEDEPRGRELGAPSSLTYQVVDGVPQIITATYGTREILGVHAETGEIMWRFPYPAPISIGLVSTPVAYGSRLLVSGNEGKGKIFAACLEMSAETGRVSYEVSYSSTELQTNNYNTPAVYQDAVFGFGGNRTAGFLHCTNLDDGRLLWKDESRDWTSDQNLVIADGLLFALTKGGQLVMAEASRQRYHELARMQIDLDLGRPQQPTIANGRMYIRGNQTVICYQIGQ